MSLFFYYWREQIKITLGLRPDVELPPNEKRLGATPVVIPDGDDSRTSTRDQDQRR